MIIDKCILFYCIKIIISVVLQKFSNRPLTNNIIADLETVTAFLQT